MMRRVFSYGLLTALLLFSGCNALEWLGGVTHDQLESPRLKPYLEAADRSRRADLGFTPLPREGLVRVERPRSKRHYDVMLHIERANVSRTVAFLLRGDTPEWSGEQEIHYSEREFTTVDGTGQEHLVLSFSTVKGSGVPKGGYVSYWGPDQVLRQRSMQNQIPVSEVHTIWATWVR